MKQQKLNIFRREKDCKKIKKQQDHAHSGVDAHRCIDAYRCSCLCKHFNVETFGFVYSLTAA